MAVAHRSHAAALVLFISSLGVGFAQTSTPPPAPSQQDQRHQLEEFYRSHYAKHEYHVPMRDGVKLSRSSTRPSPKQFTDRGPYPFLMTRTPYSCGNYGEDKSLQPRHRQSQPHPRRLHPRLPGRARPLEQRRPLVRDDALPKTARASTSPPTCTTPSTGCSRTSPTTTARSASWASAIPASTPRPASSTATPRSRPPARRRPSPTSGWATTPTTAAPSCSPPTTRSTRSSSRRRRTRLPRSRSSDFDFRTKDMYAYYLRMGTLAQPRLTRRAAPILYFHDQVAHTTYDDYWQSATSHAAHARREGGGARGRRLVRRGRPRRPGQALPLHRQAQPRSAGEHARRRPVGARRLGTRPRHLARRHPVRRQPFDLLPRQHRSSLLRALAEEQTVDRAAQGLHLRNRHATSGRSTTPGRRKQAVAKTLYLQPDGGLAWSAPTAPASKDSYISDPAHPVPFVPYVTGPDSSAALHGRRPALRHTPRRRARLPDRAAHRRRHRRRPHQAEA